MGTAMCTRFGCLSRLLFGYLGVFTRLVPVTEQAMQATCPRQYDTAFTLQDRRSAIGFLGQGLGRYSVSSSIS